MGSDRARETYDRAKQYRRVVPQQGRVELEADKNEAYEIVTENARLETIDIVAPYGVPSDPVTGAKGTGYQIGPAPAGSQDARDFSIGAGILYVGGWRIEQPDPGLTYDGQSSGDWVDGPVSPNEQPRGDLPRREAIYLHLIEQEVSAVEDVSLREVALGGPDTAQRVRLTRHVVRFATGEARCSDAFQQIIAFYAQLGATFDPDTMALRSDATLLVIPEAGGGPPNPCDPAAVGGYLGAENQMIRVQIAQGGANAGGPQLLWAYDDGSDFYRVDVTAQSPRTLTLRNFPVDTYHWPKNGQTVEVVVAGVKLGDDDYVPGPNDPADSPSKDDYIAAPFGIVATLGADYDSDTRTLTLSQDLSPAVTGAAAVFVRVWQNAQSFTPSAPTALVDRTGTDIGVQVRLDGKAFRPGDFWTFALRPTTPELVYPVRYALTPQHPEGPRQWIAPLAIAGWTNPPQFQPDCRPPFDNLVQLTARPEGQGGCCTVVVSPSDAPNLQQIIDQAVGSGGAVTVCLRPGRYDLAAPLVFNDARYAGLVLEGTQEGGQAELAAASSAVALFFQGVVQITEVSVTLRNLTITLPNIPAQGITALPQTLSRDLTQMNVSIGVGVVDGPDCVIDGCNFSSSAQSPAVVVAILAAGDVTGLEVTRCTFRGTGVSASKKNVMAAFVLTQRTIFTLTRTNDVGTAQVLPSALGSGLFRGNTFVDLTFCAIAVGQLGVVRVEDNDVTGGYGGFIFLSEVQTATAADVLAGGASADARQILLAMLALARDPWLRALYVFSSAYPLPPGTDTSRLQSPAAPPRGQTLQKVANAKMDAYRQAAVSKVQSTFAGGAGGTAKKAAATKVRTAATFDMLASRPQVDVPGAFPATSAAVDVVHWAWTTPVTTAGPDTKTSSLHFEDNDVNLALTGAGWTALAFYDDTGNAVLTGNRLVNLSFSTPTAVVVTRRTVASGNVIANLAVESYQTFFASALDHVAQFARTEGVLSMFENVGKTGGVNINLTPHSLGVAIPSASETTGVAVMSNVFEAPPILPARDPALGPPWQQLNTEM